MTKRQTCIKTCQKKYPLKRTRKPAKRKKSEVIRGSWGPKTKRKPAKRKLTLAQVISKAKKSARVAAKRARKSDVPGWVWMQTSNPDLAKKTWGRSRIYHGLYTSMVSKNPSSLERSKAYCAAMSKVLHKHGYRFRCEHRLGRNRPLLGSAR